MTILRNISNLAVAVLLSVWMGLSMVAAQDAGDGLNRLFDQLRDPQVEDWEGVERSIWRAWGRSGSASADFLLYRGRVALQDGNVDRAIEHFSAVIDHAPEFPEGWNARATAFYMADRYGESIDDIRETLAREPRHFGALGGLGMILEELGDFDNALAAYEAAAAIHPRKPSLNEALERVRLKAGGREL